MQVIEAISGVWFFGDVKEAVPGEKAYLQTTGRKAEGAKASNPGHRIPSNLSAWHGELATSCT